MLAEGDTRASIIALLVLAPIFFWLMEWFYTLVRRKARIGPVRRGVPRRRREAELDKASMLRRLTHNRQARLSGKSCELLERQHAVVSQRS